MPSGILSLVMEIFHPSGRARLWIASAGTWLVAIAAVATMFVVHEDSGPWMRTGVADPICDRCARIDICIGSARMECISFVALNFCPIPATATVTATATATTPLPPHKTVLLPIFRALGGLTRWLTPLQRCKITTCQNCERGRRCRLTKWIIDNGGAISGVQCVNRVS